MTREDAIREMTQRILAVCSPLRIYLFGSTARGDSGPDSDLDFLVVLPDDAPRDLVQGSLLDNALWGIPWAADVIPWRVSDFEGRAAHVVASLPAVVSREGKLLCRQLCRAKVSCSMTRAQWLLDETGKWLLHAARDVRAAELCAPELPAEALYHCQQAAEK